VDVIPTSELNSQMRIEMPKVLDGFQAIQLIHHKLFLPLFNHGFTVQNMNGNIGVFLDPAE